MTAQQCAGSTLAGRRCRARTLNPDGYCRYHGPAPIPVEPEPQASAWSVEPPSVEPEPERPSWWRRLLKGSA